MNLYVDDKQVHSLGTMGHHSSAGNTAERANNVQTIFFSDWPKEGEIVVKNVGTKLWDEHYHRERNMNVNERERGQKYEPRSLTFMN